MKDLSISISEQSETFRPSVREWAIAKEEKRDRTNMTDQKESETHVQEDIDWEKLALCQYLRIPCHQQITE